MTASAQQFTDYAQHQLASSATNAGLTLTWDSVAGWPIIGNFMLKVDDPSPATTFEWVEVTSVNVGANQTTVTRGQNNTTGIAHSAGAFGGNKVPAAMLVRGFGQGVLAGGLATAVANQGAITTLVDLASLTITVTLLAGRLYRISSKAGFSSTIANDQISMLIVDTTGPANLDNYNLTLAAVGAVGFAEAEAVFASPGAGARTYKLQAVRLAGTGTITMSASAVQVARILIEDIGQA
jgi:hypothetical protein